MDQLDLCCVCRHRGVHFFYTDFTTAPSAVTVCYDAGTMSTVSAETSEEFASCLAARAKRFRENDYTESKDLAKAFLTLLTAVFVGSITFSEKIVDIKAARSWAKCAMISCWVLLLVAIIACGTGLAYMTIAAGGVTYEPALDIFFYELRGVYLFIISGIAFGLALIVMLLAGLTAFLPAPAVSPSNGGVTNARLSTVDSEARSGAD